MIWRFFFATFCVMGLLVSSGFVENLGASSLPGRCDRQPLPPSGIPLYFEINKGQADPEVSFLARGPGYTLFLTDTGPVFSFGKDRNSWISKKPRPEADSRNEVRMGFLGANPRPALTGMGELSGKVSYFIGKNPESWVTNIPTYSGVRYEKLYPGADLVFYDRAGRIECDLIVSPGTDVRTIGFELTGTSPLRIGAQGDLDVITHEGVISFLKPFAYQERDGVRRAIPCGYALPSTNTVVFETGEYDIQKPLVIDPVIVYSTYFGTQLFDEIRAIGVDADYNTYVTGIIGESTPLAFVAKLHRGGSPVDYVSIFGGSSTNSATGIAVDAAGSVYVTGLTDSRDFPVTPEAFQQTMMDVFGSAFVSKLSPDGGSFVYSTYLHGGPNVESAGTSETLGTAIVVDRLCNAYVTGSTSSMHFPVTDNAYQKTLGGNYDVFVTKLDPTGSALVFSTYIGGSGSDEAYGIARDARGNIYVGGATSSEPQLPGENFPTTPGAFQAASDSYFSDGFVSKLDKRGSVLLYSTCLGGTYVDSVTSLAVTRAGYACVTGQTKSPDFPVLHPLRPPGQNVDTFGDAFVTKFNLTGTGLVHSTYLGGQFFDVGYGIAVDAAGHAYVAGSTNSPDFPVVRAWQRVPGGNDDAFVAKILPDGSAFGYSTFLGGSTNDQANAIAARNGKAFVGGRTTSREFPTVQPVQRSSSGGYSTFDGFIAEIITNPGSSADLSVALTGANNRAQTRTTYQIILRNNGPDTAGAVVLDDVLPPAPSRFRSVSTSKGKCRRSGDRVACSFGDLLVGEEVAVQIVVTYATTTDFYNTARVSSRRTEDPRMSNNVASLWVVGAAP